MTTPRMGTTVLFISNVYDETGDAQREVEMVTEPDGNGGERQVERVIHTGEVPAMITRHHGGSVVNLTVYPDCRPPRDLANIPYNAAAPHFELHDAANPDVNPVRRSWRYLTDAPE